MTPSDYAGASSTWYEADLKIALDHEPINDDHVCKILCRMWLCQLMAEGASEYDYWGAVPFINASFGL